MTQPFETFERPSPTCPHCGYAMATDDMVDHTINHDDLFELAPNEGIAAVTCPQCGKEYAVQGGYRPHYTSAVSEDELT
jgi:hypothetical protein